MLCYFFLLDISSAVTRPKKRPSRKPLPVRGLVCKNALPSQAEFNRVFRDRHALDKQNFVVDFWDLERAEDAEDLKMLVEAERLVPVHASSPTHYLDPALNKRTWFARPFVRDFIKQFTEDFYFATQADKVKFVVNTNTGKVRKISKGTPKKIKITALVRDRRYQADLVKKLPKGQAASDQNGPRCQSSHLAGTTFDFSTKDFTLVEKCWVLQYLYRYQAIDKINVIWEPKNNAIHVMVFPLPTSTEHLN